MSDKKSQLVVSVTKSGNEGEPTLEQIVDSDLDEFERFFCGELKNDSLARSERAILKTYLYYKAKICGAHSQEDTRG